MHYTRTIGNQHRWVVNVWAEIINYHNNHIFLFWGYFEWYRLFEISAMQFKLARLKAHIPENVSERMWFQQEGTAKGSVLHSFVFN